MPETKPETPAEVLAEMRDRKYRRFYTKAREWADRLERALSARAAVPEGWHAALVKAEAALADIGDADREPGDDVAWCERRAAEALPAVRAMLAAAPQPAGEAEPGCDECDGYDGFGGHCLMCGKDLSSPEPAPSAPVAINSPPEFPDNCVDSSAPADVEGLCDACKGSGEVIGIIPHPHSGDPQDAVKGMIPCPECDAEGVLSRLPTPLEDLRHFTAMRCPPQTRARTIQSRATGWMP